MNSACEARRPRLLDLFCGAGGASAGYHRAGFEAVGVDLRPMPRYPFEFHQGDALEYLAEHGRRFDAIHASPPCHDHTALSSLAGEDGTGWLLAATRDALSAIGLPWVIENVPGAPIRRDVVLCGEMFGLRTYRHRWFELSGFFAMTPAHPPHVVRTSTKKRRACWDAGMHISVTGDVGSYVGSQAMGIDWMTGNELSQAIPPAYTEHIGRQLLAELARQATEGAA
jgi:DNA (cytosine-5)-methyltransferase 1